MEFEWDPRKAAANPQKARDRLRGRATVLYDDLAITVPDDHPEEERSVTMGMDALGRLLVVVHTWRDERGRLISARQATGRERRQYEEGR